jgi:hypothetical protein
MSKYVVKVKFDLEDDDEYKLFNIFKDIEMNHDLKNESEAMKQIIWDCLGYSGQALGFLDEKWEPTDKLKAMKEGKIKLEDI